MSTTVRVAENPGIRVTHVAVDPRPPDSLGFRAEGVVRPSRTLLSRFEGSTVTPVRVDLAVHDSRTVPLDLDGDASLRLESVDVGVVPPDGPGVSDAGDGADGADGADGVDAVDSVRSDDAGSADDSAGAITLTVEGTFRDLPGETLTALDDGSPTLESVTFSVSEAAETDGGSPGDVLLDVTLFGYGVVVRRNGTVEIGRSGDSSALDLF